MNNHGQKLSVGVEKEVDSAKLGTWNSEIMVGCN